MRWTKELLINELRKTSTNGYAISVRENAALRGAACRLFGTWSAACDAAGLKVVSAPKELGRCIVSCSPAAIQLMGGVAKLYRNPPGDRWGQLTFCASRF
jgi:hypothetical protein